MIRTLTATAVVCLVSAPATARDIRLFDPEFAPGRLLGAAHGARVGSGVRPFAGLLFDFADDEVVRIETPLTDGQSRRVALVDDRLTMNIGAGVGLFEVASIAVALPVLLTGAAGDFGPVTIGDLRLHGRVRFAGDDDRGVGLSLIAGMTLPTAERTAWNGLGAVSGHVGFGAHWLDDDSHTLTLSLVWRFRPSLPLETAALGDDLRFTVGGRVVIDPQLAIMAEIDALIPAAGTAPRTAAGVAHMTPIEGRLGIGYDLGHGFELSAFSGAGLTGGLGAPDFRVGLGLAWRLSESAETSNSNDTHDGNNVGTEIIAGPGPGSALQPLVVDATTFAAALAADPDGDADGLVRCPATDGPCPEGFDRCPEAPEDRDGFADADGCPDRDNDSDGIPDTRDACPDTAETFNGVDDGDGCPDTTNEPATTQIRENDDQLAVGDIPFRSGSDELAGDSPTRLGELATFLRNRPGIARLVIEGHTDDRGDKEFNVDLSERRASRVRAFLVEAGIEPGRLVARGYGATRPVASNGSERGRAANRRVVFRIDRDFRAVPSGTGGAR